MKYNDPEITIDEFFTYHPVETEERQRMHNLVNHHTLHLALLIKTCFDTDDPSFNELIGNLQIIRMFLNQQIMVDEVKHIKRFMQDSQNDLEKV